MKKSSKESTLDAYPRSRTMQKNQVSFKHFIKQFLDKQIRTKAKLYNWLWIHREFRMHHFKVMRRNPHTYSDLKKITILYRSLSIHKKNKKKEISIPFKTMSKQKFANSQARSSQRFHLKSQIHWKRKQKSKMGRKK